MTVPLSYSAIILTSLVGSLHCIGMCGGFVGVYCLGCAKNNSAKRHGATKFVEHLSYNFGRLLSYLLLGAIGGFLGKGIESGGEILAYQGLAALLAGSVVLVWGTISLLQSVGMRIGRFEVLQSFYSRIVNALFRLTQKLPARILPFAIGLLTTGLPCGWLYLFVAAAASTGSPLHGMIVMFCFWLGTVPALFAVGYGLQRLAEPAKRFFPVVSGVLMILIGLLTISGRFVPELSLMDHSQHHHTHSGMTPAEPSGDKTESADHQELNHSGMDHSTMNHQKMNHQKRNDQLMDHQKMHDHPTNHDM